MNLASQIRHFLTFLAGLGGLLFSWHLLAPEQVAAVNAAGADLIAPLTIILGAIAACVARLAIGWVVSLFQRGAGEGGSTGGLGGPSVQLILLTLTAAALLGLPSCATTVTTNVLPDGTKVTITAKSADPVAIKAAMEAAQLIMPTVDTLIARQNANKATEAPAK